VRKLGTVFSGTAAVSVVAAVGWPGLILALAVIAFVVAGACWVLNDAGRAARLTRLVRELRGRKPR
jgi:Flp pilus assembly protein TadB